MTRPSSPREIPNQERINKIFYPGASQIHPNQYRYHKEQDSAFEPPVCQCPTCETGKVHPTLDWQVNPALSKIGPYVSYAPACPACLFGTKKREATLADRERQEHRENLLASFRDGYLPVGDSDGTDVPLVPEAYRELEYPALPQGLRAELDKFINREFWNLLFLGNTGARKTGTAWLLCLEWLRRNGGHQDGVFQWPCVEWVRWQDFLRISSASLSYPKDDVEYDNVESIHPDFAKRKMAAFKSAALLVIDDFLTQSATTENQHGRLYDVIDHRNVNKFATLLTSNCANGGEFAQRAGQRIASRMMDGGGLVVPFAGDDERLKVGRSLPPQVW